MDSPELLPCPFCGGSAEIERAGTMRASTIYACTQCGCRLETGEVWDIGVRWNSRASVSDARVAEAMAIVKDAYNTGFLEGMREHTSHRGGIPWNESKIRAVLARIEEAGNG